MTQDDQTFEQPEHVGSQALTETTLAAPDAAAVITESEHVQAAVTTQGIGVRERLSDWAAELLLWGKTLASAAVYTTLIVTFVFQVARVEGTSMAPTLADQDRLVVNKLVYLVNAPQRGDVVMMYYPEDPDKTFVKRVIGEPGDVIRIVGGQVFVNDAALHDDFVLPEFRSHDDFGPSTVPRGYYFVMGDHRNNSSDSRIWGPVPKRYIVGRVQLRWWPLPRAHAF